jgi:serine/threonine-protein kinase
MSEHQLPRSGVSAGESSSLKALQRIDAICVRFEEAWQQGPRPTLEAYLDDVPEPKRAALLEQLLLLDIHYRKKAGETPTPEDYRHRFPQYEEVLHRPFSSPTPAPDPSSVPDDGGGDAERTTPYIPGGSDAQLPAIPGYETLNELGQGGMGVVYRCLDIAMERVLAVKIIKAEYKDNAELKRRFVDEAKVMGQLQHPGIAPIHEIGTLDDGRPYFSMKQVQGRTLADILREKTTGLPQLVGIFEHVCQAVAFAHSHGILHRDLKLGNVMVGAFGEVQVMDWGLAKRLARYERMTDQSPPRQQGIEPIVGIGQNTPITDETQAGHILGTPAYMAPEQARGQIDQLDERCDMFGLGAILCEILTGDPPYTGRNREEILRKAMQASLAEAWQRLDGCAGDAELISLTQHCLQPRRDDRPRDASKIAAAVA